MDLNWFLQNFDPGQVLTMLFLLIGFVPVMGGTVGNVLSGVLDLVKMLLHMGGVELPEEWWGRIYIAGNFVLALVIGVLVGGNPFETPIPPNIDAILAAVVQVIPIVMFLLGQIFGGQLLHRSLKKAAPTVFSTTERQKSRDLALAA